MGKDMTRYFLSDEIQRGKKDMKIHSGSLAIREYK